MASLLEAIEIKRKMFFEYENAPYHCLDVEVSKPTARGGQTLVRLKMRNLLTRAVFDRTFKAGDKFREPDLDTITASYLYADGSGHPEESRLPMLWGDRLVGRMDAKADRVTSTLVVLSTWFEGGIDANNPNLRRALDRGLERLTSLISQ